MNNGKLAKISWVILPENARAPLVWKQAGFALSAGKRVAWTAVFFVASATPLVLDSSKNKK